MLLTFGVLTTKFTLFEIVLRERLQMNTIYPSYFWWKNPEPEVLLKMYVFNITNSAEFIAGTDMKLKLQEVGPITFQEVLQHKDVVFHSENSTLSYTASRHIVFKESANVKGILNQTVTIVNMAALSGCSIVADTFFQRRGFNALLNLYNTRPVVTTTLYNYFFNLTEPVL
jgi:scavenger receptor class B, member 1